MTTQKTTSQKKRYNSDNPLEKFNDVGADNIFDQLLDFGQKNSEETAAYHSQAEKPVKKAKKEFSLFNYQEHYENEIIKRQISELTDAIKKEIEMLKKSDKSLLSEVGDIQKIALENMPSRPGIYDVRFLEIVLNILRALRAKVGESRTWMQALISKKKKRGSLFASLSKKKGTQYSLSQELSSARSVQ